MRYEFKKRNPIKIPWTLRIAPAVFLAGAITYARIQGFKEGWQGVKPPNLETAVVQPVQDTNEPARLENKISEANSPAYTEDDIDWLAIGMYGEARGEAAAGYLDYVKGFANSVVTRAKRKNMSVKDTLLQKTIKRTKKGKITVYQYTCFDPISKANRKNYQEVTNPTDLKTLRLCRQIAKQLLTENKSSEVTNYYVGKPATGKKYKSLREIRKANIPSWAFEMRDNKYFKRDKEGYFIPRTPKKITSVRETKTKGSRAYFYNFKYF